MNWAVPISAVSRRGKQKGECEVGEQLIRHHLRKTWWITETAFSQLAVHFSLNLFLCLISLVLELKFFFFSIDKSLTPLLKFLTFLRRNGPTSCSL